MTAQTFFSCFLIALPAAAQSTIPSPSRDFRVDVAALLRTSPTLQRAHFGFKVVDLQTGRILAQQNAASFFTPASNAKLYTTAFALTRLGPAYQFQTELRTFGSWQPGASAVPDLQLVGGGDPDLSGRAIPYAVDAPDGDPLAGIRDLALKLTAAGVREIDGDVTGVSTRYVSDPYPDGWTLDDAIYGYGAPVSSLAVNDNILSLSLHPAEPGELALLELNPSVDHFVILNQVVTDNSDRPRIQVTRPPGSNEVILWGTIGIHSPAWQEDLGVDNPALFASESLLQALRENGVVVRGSPAAEYCSPSLGPEASLHCADKEGSILATHFSPPLSQAVRIVNKVSQNLHAEMLLRETSYVTAGSGALAAAVSAREDFLRDIGVTREGTGFTLGDGSGLARQDLTTPNSTVTLLQSMWQSPLRDAWVASLPIGGVDGSLQHRFHNMVGADHVHAKTGSIAHASSLSGYIETQQHGWLAFSLMVNGAVGHDADVHTFIDSFCGLFLGY